MGMTRGWLSWTLDVHPSGDLQGSSLSFSRVYSLPFLFRWYQSSYPIQLRCFVANARSVVATVASNHASSSQGISNYKGLQRSLLLKPRDHRLWQALSNLPFLDRLLGIPWKRAAFSLAWKCWKNSPTESRRRRPRLEADHIECTPRRFISIPSPHVCEGIDSESASDPWTTAA